MATISAGMPISCSAIRPKSGGQLAMRMIPVPAPPKISAQWRRWPRISWSRTKAVTTWRIPCSGEIRGLLKLRATAKAARASSGVGVRTAVDYGRSQRIEEAAQGQGQKEGEELALARRITHVGLEIPIPAETDGRQEFEPDLGAEAGVMAEGVDEIEPRAEELLRWGSGARPPRR